MRTHTTCHACRDVCTREGVATLAVLLLSTTQVRTLYGSEGPPTPVNANGTSAPGGARYDDLSLANGGQVPPTRAAYCNALELGFSIPIVIPF